MFDLYKYLLDEGYKSTSQIRMTINNKELLVPIKSFKKERYGEWERLRYDNGRLHPYKRVCSGCGYVSNEKPFPPPYCKECGQKNAAV